MNPRFLTLASIVALAALARLLPHPPNVTPIAAMALFGGAYLQRRHLAYVLPLAAMVLSDLVLGYFIYGRSIFSSQPVVYACIAATVAMGRLLTQRRAPIRIVTVALASSILFFLVTNFACWAFDVRYPHTAGGLLACYTAGVPFFRNTLAGDIGFTVLLFGGFTALEWCLPRLREPQTAMAV